MSRIGCASWVGLVGLALLSSCALLANSFSYQPNQPKVLRSDLFAMTVDDAQTDMGVKDFIFDVTVENVSSSDQVFDSAELEVSDLTTGSATFRSRRTRRSFQCRLPT